MRKMEYYTQKWEKTREKINKYNQYELEQIDFIQKQYDANKIDKIRYLYSLSVFYISITKYYYVNGNAKGCIETVEKITSLYCECILLFKEGKETIEGIKRNILRELDSGAFGYFALLVNKVAEMNIIANENASISKMMKGSLVEASDCIERMQNAIVLKDSQQFNSALIDRIKEIRKFDLDNYLCADFYSLALMKFAVENGMSVEGDYAETNLSLFIE